MYRSYVNGVLNQSTMYSPHTLQSTFCSTIQPFSSISGGSTRYTSSVSTIITYQAQTFISYETMYDIKTGGVLCRANV
jgi:hypothetical protein